MKSLLLVVSLMLAGAANAVQGSDARVDAAERQRVLDQVVFNLKQHYPDPQLAKEMADALLAHAKAGDYAALSDGESFANALTRQMREVSHDNDLIVVYSLEPRPQRSMEPPAAARAQYRQAMEQQNCTFESVKVLPGNIGYVKLNSFPEVSVCRGKAESAMKSVDRVGALIFDLRDNRGGFPDMVGLIAAYLFDHPEYWYNPRENTTVNSWTKSPVPGTHLADKPIYVLTSKATLSGAEQFTYDLKMLRRATIVGETTGGAAHSGTFHRIDEHFGMAITESRAINPFSKQNWDGTGVEPDVKVRPADALATAEKLAARRLAEKKGCGSGAD